MNRRVIAVLLLSFSSALPLVLVGSTLQAWYTVAGVNLLTIGSLSLVGQPYVYKFLWAPLMDRFVPLKIGRRRGWIFLMQIALVIGLVVMAYMHPKTHPWWLAAVALGVAFFSASQDIAIDAYRVDVLRSKERGLGAAVTNFGGRLAVLVGGAFAMILAAQIGWHVTYLIMAALMLLEIIITFWSPRPEQNVSPPKTLSGAVVEPVRNFIKRSNWIALLVFIVIYKLCDAFAFSLNTTFLLRGVHFTLEEVGVIYKVVSIVALLVGSFVGGIWMRRLGLFRSLLYFGVLQAVANLAYMALALVGKSYTVMATSVFAEYFCSGLSTVAFIAFLMSLCDRRYSASQYALFSAFMAIGRVFVGPEAALMVEHFGWATFYFITFLIGMPPLVMLMWLKRRMDFNVAEAIG